MPSISTEEVDLIQQEEGLEATSSEEDEEDEQQHEEEQSVSRPRPSFKKAVTQDEGELERKKKSKQLERRRASDAGPATNSSHILDVPGMHSANSSQLPSQVADSKRKRARRATVSFQTEGYEFRGVSVKHIAVDLIQEMGKQGLPRESKVAEIEETVIRGIGTQIICPRDQRWGSAYVDAVQGIDNAGLANFMLSYSWGYKVSDIADTLSHFCNDEEENLSRAYFWICCLCINQHRVKEAQTKGTIVPADEFRKVFRDRVVGIGHLVCMMTPWNEPGYIKRAWCNFEMFSAVTIGEKVCRVSIVMPPKETTDFHTALMKEGKGLNEFWKVMGKLDVEKSEASIENDREHIFTMIRAGPGFHELNIAICKHLRTWVVDSSERHIRKCIADESFDATHAATICRKIGNLVRKLGQRERALSLYEVARELREHSGTFETEDGAALLRSIGATKGAMKDSEGQLRAYMDAKNLLQRIDGLKSQEAAMLMDHIGDALRFAGDLDGAIQYLQEAREIYDSLGELDSQDGAYLLKNIAMVKIDSNDVSGAKTALEEAKVLFEAQGMNHTPDYALVLESLCTLVDTQGGDASQIGEDSELHLQAHMIRQKSGTPKAMSRRRSRKQTEAIQVVYDDGHRSPQANVANKTLEAEKDQEGEENEEAEEDGLDDEDSEEEKADIESEQQEHRVDEEACQFATRVEKFLKEIKAMESWSSDFDKRLSLAEEKWAALQTPQGT